MGDPRLSYGDKAASGTADRVVEDRVTQPQLKTKGVDLAERVRKAPEKIAKQMLSDLSVAGHSPESWFSQIDSQATFLGLSIKGGGGTGTGIHKELHDRLELAEGLLAQEFKASGKQLAEYLGVYSVGGLRSPKAATDGTRISMHCY